MIGRTLREYGLIIALVVIGLGSLFYYQRFQRFDLEDAIDDMSARLIDVVEETGGRNAVAGLMDVLKSKVISREVAPEQVELLAVNVMSLSQSGERLTTEEAEEVISLVLGEEMSGEIESATFSTSDEESDIRTETGSEVRGEGTIEATKAEAPSTAGNTRIARVWPFDLSKPRPPPTEDDLAELGERLHVLMDFEDAVNRIKRDAPEYAEIMKHIDVRSGSRPRFVVDVNLRDELRKAGLDNAERALRRMESADLLEWKRDDEQAHREVLAAARSAEREIETDLPSMDHLDHSVRLDLIRLERLRKLESKGVVLPFDVDSLQQAIESHLKQALEAEPNRP